eukprot:6473620-Alexandrium_andersonii.AAC.1
MSADAAPRSGSVFLGAGTAPLGHCPPPFYAESSQPLVKADEPTGTPLSVAGGGEDAGSALEAPLKRTRFCDTPGDGWS